MRRINSISFSALLINITVTRNQYWTLKSVSMKKKNKIGRNRSDKHKRSNLLVCRILWKNFARLLQSLASTAQNTTKTQRSYLMSLLYFERPFELAVIKRTNQCVSFMFPDVQLSDFLNFHGGATSFDSLLKAFETS